MKYLTARLGYFATPLFFPPGVLLSRLNLGEEQRRLTAAKSKREDIGSNRV
jgi:hypothetical protein